MSTSPEIPATRPLLELCHMLKADSFYQKNVEGALANGIAVGCYFYSYALSVPV